LTALEQTRKSNIDQYKNREAKIAQENALLQENLKIEKELLQLMQAQVTNKKVFQYPNRCICLE